jgi:hypothetical protein
MLLPLFRWLDHTAVALWIRDSTWAFALMEVVHLFGLTLLLGSIAVINLRLLGWGLKKQSVTDVTVDLRPWVYLGLAVSLISGTLLFVSEALKCYASDPFFIKMGLLFFALILSLGYQLRMSRGGRVPAGIKVVAVLSLVLWFGVGLAGRAIAFF